MISETNPVSTDAQVGAIDASMMSDEEARQREQASASIKHWSQRIAAGRRIDKDEHKLWAEWRKYAQGGRKSQWLVDTNLIQATIEGLMPFMYAKDPDFSVRPDESVGEQRYEQVKRFAATLQQVISRLFRDGGLKRIMKRCIRSAMTVSQGWVKITFQLDPARDPVIERRIADIQDNLQRIDALHRQITEDDDTAASLDVKREELRAQMAALEQRVEIMVGKGLAIDTVQAEDIQVDGSVRELVDYVNSAWIAQRVWMPRIDVESRFPALTKDDLDKATVYHTRKGDDVDDSNTRTVTRAASQTGPDKTGWMAIWEIWDREAQTIRTLIDGAEVWARDPYPPVPAGKRFYPFFMLSFHHVDGERHPVADVEFWHKLQDEYSRTRSQFAEHRKRAIPARIAARDAITPEDAKKVTNPDINELILIDRINPSEPVGNIVSVVQNPSITFEAYTTDPIRSDLEMVSGLQDANRGGVIKAKTATEAEILNTGVMSRMDERVDVIEDLMSEMAQYAAELSLQVLSADEAITIAGPEAEWPQLSRDDLYSLVSIQIQAGSTGKPNTARDRESWSQLLPVIIDLLTKVFELRQAGQDAMAEAAIELLKETVRRSDERLDVERFIPKQIAPPSLPPGVDPGQLPAAAGGQLQ